MPAALTPEQIESLISALPIQGRIMLRLLLLQYLDVTEEDIEYMAADRPDPRLQSGVKSTVPTLSRETIQGVADRVTQYRTQIRFRRQRTWLMSECLRKQIAHTEALCAQVKRLLVSRFGVTAEGIQDSHKQARTAVLKPAIRDLARKWDQDDITEEEYRKARLNIEYQIQLRMLDRQRKRLQLALREHDHVGEQPPQDHEIAHIWGIPASSLAARKVKFLHQYLQGIQATLREAGAAETATTAPVDLWKETFRILSTRPVERPFATYDGLEGNEAALLEKLKAFAVGSLPEELEGRFWLTIIQDSRPAAEHGAKPPSLFALQRLSAILGDLDASPETLEQDLLERVSPRPKAVPTEPPSETKPAQLELGEMGEHILKSFRGE